MKRFLSIFNSKGFPKAFVFFLLALVILECVSAKIIAFLPPRNFHQRMLKKIEGKKFNARTVVLGDSFIAYALYGKDMATTDTTESLPYTISLGANVHVHMAGQYFTLKRYLELNEAPKRVIFVMVPRSWEVTKFKDNYFSSVFTDTSEITDVLLTTGDVKLAVRQLFFKLLPSSTFRLYFAELKLKSPEKRNQMFRYLLGRVFKKTGSGEGDLKKVFKPRVLKGDSTALGPDDLEEFRRDNKEFDAVLLQEIYFNKMCKMLKDKGIKAYYVDAAVPRGLYEIKQEVDYFKDARDFVKNLEKTQGNFVYLEEVLPGYIDDRYFFDIRHMNADGNKLYFSSFKRFLKRLELRERKGYSQQ